jgi:large conductance mechanosensitive channel
MNIFAEFRKFIARGNVLDLAMGVVIGAAFGKIVTSLTESIIMPFIGWLFGDIDFSNYFLRLGSIPEGYDGSLTNYAELKEAGVAMIGYGDFLTQLVNFLVIAAALFMLLRTVNRVLDEMQEKQGASEDSAKQDDIPTDPQLDVLKKILAEMRSGKTPATP